MAQLVNPLDARAQLLWEQVRRRITWAKEALSGPAPVGAKRLTGVDAQEALLRMSHEELTRRLARGEGEGALAQMVASLGPSALPLLPYLQPAEPTEEEPGLDQQPLGGMI
ncbi:MAG: hypothetical protein QW838_04245 [Candidatus Nitrosotenuis sp.]